MVITDYNGWRLPELVDKSLLPRRFLEGAEAARKESAGDLIGWIARLNKMPTRSSDGKTEDNFFHLFVGGRCAPSGKHLVWIWSQRTENGVRDRGEGELDRSFPSWEAAQSVVDQLLERVWSLYSDLDQCIDWAQYMYQRAPHGGMWRQRVSEHFHSVDISTIEGLFVVSQTCEDYHYPLEIDTALALRRSTSLRCDEGISGLETDARIPQSFSCHALDQDGE